MRRAILLLNRNLRLYYNPAYDDPSLHLVPVYIFDKDIAAPLKTRSNWYLNESLKALQTKIKERGGQIYVGKGSYKDIIPPLIAKIKPDAILVERPVFEPEKIAFRQLEKIADSQHVRIRVLRGNYLTDFNGVLSSAGSAFKVFQSFFKKSYKERSPIESDIPNKEPRSKFLKPKDLLCVKDLNPNFAFHEESALRAWWKPGEDFAREKFSSFLRNRLNEYLEKRDRLDHCFTSKLSAPLHFGEISVAEVVSGLLESERTSLDKDAAFNKFISELFWREFCAYQAFYFGNLEDHAQNENLAEFPYENNEEYFSKWKSGQSGYPIIDAAMRELNLTGFMHNRARMIVASFLTKEMLVDWRLGCRYFKQKLIDYDYASNSYNWQWVAGVSYQAMQMTRVFNPELQAKKFDPNARYVKTHVEELSNKDKGDIFSLYREDGPGARGIYARQVLDRKERVEKFVKVLKQYRRS